MNILRSKRMLIMGAGVALALATFIVWRIYLVIKVHSELKAVHTAGYPTDWAELNQFYPAVPDRENAALVMIQALALLQNYPDARSNDVLTASQAMNSGSFSPEQGRLLAGYVVMNAKALAKMSEALQLSQSRYPIDFSPGWDTALPHLDPLKNLALICRTLAILDIRTSHPKEADASVKDILGLSRTLEAEPLSLSQFVRFGLIELSVKTLEDRLNAGELDGSELADLSQTMAGQKETHGIARALAGERAMMIPVFSMSLVTLNQLFFATAASQQKAPISKKSSFLMEFSGFFAHDLLFYLQATSTNIALAELPPPQNLAAQKVNGQLVETAHLHHYMLAGLALTPMANLTARECESYAYLRLAQTALAIEQFRLAQGHLPENLTELAPRFLATVPADPFDGQPLRYHRLDQGYVVYSIGSDGHDDGGRERPTTAKNNDATTYDLTFTVKR